MSGSLTPSTKIMILQNQNYFGQIELCRATGQRSRILLSSDTCRQCNFIPDPRYAYKAVLGRIDFYDITGTQPVRKTTASTRSQNQYLNICEPIDRNSNIIREGRSTVLLLSSAPVNCVWPAVATNSKLLLPGCIQLCQK